MPMGKHCYGVTHTNGRLIVGAGDGEIYSLTPEDVAKLLYKYGYTCYSLTQGATKEDTIISVCSKTDGDYAVCRLSADQGNTGVMKVGVVGVQ